MYNVSNNQSYKHIFRGCEHCSGSPSSEETYDPDNKDDIFAMLGQRITDLKFTYSSIDKYFRKRGTHAPPTCIICFENFDQETEVIQLECNKSHIYHEKCILDWFGKSKSCPLCRRENRHQVPIQVVEMRILN